MLQVLLLLRAFELRCEMIRLDRAGNFRIRGDYAPPVQYLNGIFRNGDQHSPAGMHLNTQGCALHDYLSAAWGERFINSVSLS